MQKISSTPVSIHENDRNHWWREWFNHVYLDVYAHRDEGDAEEEVKAVIPAFPLQKDDSILDLCCGNGRHSRALRRLGFQHVTGIDYSYPLLQHAQAEHPFSWYLRADMRLLPFFDKTMSMVFSFFTSFGYFSTNVENLSVLHEIARVLRPGGHFLMDYLNPADVRKSLIPESTKKHGDFIIRERRAISQDGERIEKEIVIENWGGKDHRFFESVRLYEKEELSEMLYSANLSVDGVWGNFALQSFAKDSPRMILFGHRSP